MPSPTASPVVEVNPAEEFLAPLTGFRYAPPEETYRPFLKELESGNLRDVVSAKASRSILFNGDSYHVSVYVYALRPLAAGAAGAQEDIVEKLAGSAYWDELGLGGRTVAYFEQSSELVFAWLQRTFFVVVLGSDATHAYTIASSLIDANTTEGRFIISGQVTSKANGGPLAGVEVVMFKGGFALCCDPALPSVVTGATGRFTLTVPEGNYRICSIRRDSTGMGSRGGRTAPASRPLPISPSRRTWARSTLPCRRDTPYVAR